MAAFGAVFLGREKMIESEEWVRIPGFERYWISNLGNVVREGRAQILKLDYSGRPRHPYRSVRLYDGLGGVKKLLLHRLVYRSFRGEVADGMQVDHIDRDRNNNRLSNLRCITAEENLSRRVFSEAVSEELSF